MADPKKDHERYSIPNADVLFEDVWAEEDAPAENCPECGTGLDGAVSSCPSCGSRVDVCTGSCSSCGARVCVKGKTESERR